MGNISLSEAGTFETNADEDEDEDFDEKRIASINSAHVHISFNISLRETFSILDFSVVNVKGIVPEGIRRIVLPLEG